ncbi:MAG TPA: c-type cytochrome [Kofleriaceae bacterium]|nr:c-type cytochrome [Kofleriaceae bacterium]
MRGFTTLTLFASAVAFSVACGGTSKPATTTPEPAPAVADEPAATDSAPAAASAEFTAQAEAGAAIYSESCAFCHGESGEGSAKSPAVIGEGALPATNADRPAFNTAADVLSYVSSAMPKDDPGSLSADDAAAVVAFLLSKNGVSAQAKLSADTASAVTLAH